MRVRCGMPENQQDLIAPSSLAMPAGAVNCACRFDDHGGQRFIRIHGALFYSYDLEDEISERFVWVQILLAGYANMVEVAAATGIGLRSLQRWKERAKLGGFGALLPKPITGRPRGITSALRREALRLIALGHSHAQVGSRLKLGGSSIDRIVAQDKAGSGTVAQVHLDLEEQESSIELPESGPLDTDTDTDTGRGRCGVQSTDDPLDRSLDRTFARLGLIEDADPLFAPGERLADMGFFMVVALLGAHPILRIFERVYGKELAPAFYGLRTVVMTLLMMVLLRVRRPERLRHCNPSEKGRVLGLDRVMEVKTLRRKLHQLADLNRGTDLMEQLGRARLEGVGAPADGALEIVYLDGHVQCYHGGMKIGQAWSSTRNRTVKGRTDTWLHLPGKTPLFYLESPFNESLVKVIETHQEKILDLFGQEKPVLVFDREGWDVSFLNELDEKGWKFITYRKGNYDDLPPETFADQPTQIGKRAYAHAPVDIAQQSFNLYEKTTAKSGKPGRRKVGEKCFREVRILSDDSSKQTSVVTNLNGEQAGSVTVCAAMFQRWGNQENVFKYFKQEYALDALLEYNQGVKSSEQRSAEEQIPDALDHPNPEYAKLTRQIGELAKKQTKLLARYGLEIEAKSGGDPQSGELNGEQVIKLIGKIRSGKGGQELRRISAQLEELRVKRSQCELREGVATSDHVRLRSGIKQIVDAVRMGAYDLENELFEMLAGHYPNRAKEGRKLIVGAMRSSGSLRVEEGRLVIKLEEQASPNRTRAIDAICQELDRRQAVFPGTGLRIEFDTRRPA